MVSKKGIRTTAKNMVDVVFSIRRQKWPAGEIVPDHADIGYLIEAKLCVSGR